MNHASVVKHRPKSTSAADAAFANLTRGRRRRLTLEFGGVEWQVRFAASKPTSSESGVRLTDGSSSAWIRLNDWNAIPHVEELAGGALDALPAEIQSIVLEAALSPALDALGNAVGSTWRIDEIAPWPEGASKTIGFELRDQSGGLRRGELALDASAHDLFAELLQRAPPEPSRSLDRIRLPIRMLLGETTIDRSQLAGLRTHDVVLIDRPLATSAANSSAIHALALIGERTAFQATIENGVATLGPPAAVPQSPNPQTVRFEIAATPTTVGEAKTFKARAVVPLDVGGESDVRIVASGRPIASGPLVSCGGKLGVRIQSNVKLDAAAPR